MSEKKNEVILICRKCGSGDIYTRIGSNERVCRRCGNVEKIKEND